MSQNKKTKVGQVEAGVKKVTTVTLDGLQQVVDSTEKRLEHTVAPIRQSLFKRFPTLFLLAATFGVTATVLGIEQILLRYQALQTHPALILAIGLAVLVVTGRLYKILG